MNQTKIAVLTSGGDAPGMNKVLNAISKYAIKNQLEVYVVINGFEGLVNNDIYLMNHKIINNNANNAGSIIYCSRFKAFNEEVNYLKAIENLKQHQIDYLIVLGGNGSYMGAKLLAQHHIKTICIPCTIDNDINYTDFSIGYLSALNIIVESIQTLRFNAKSHGNIYLVEIMGRECSDLTIASAFSADIDYIITSNNIKSKQELLDIIIKIKQQNKRDVFILFTENIYQQAQIYEIADYIQEQTHISTKVHILGFMQRGAKPTGYELFNATRMGYYAIDCINNHLANIALCFKDNTLTYIDLLNNDFHKKDDFNETIKMLNKINI